MTSKGNKKAGQKSCQWGTLDWFASKLHQHGLNSPAAYYGLGGYQRHRHRLIVELARDLGIPRKRNALLDIGCGTGHMTDLFRRELEFRNATGIDFLPELVNAIGELYPNVKYQVGSLPNLDFADEQFDLVIASEVLYYLDADARIRALHEIRRVTKPSGIFLMSSALGPKYFSELDAMMLVETQFRISHIAYMHNRTYHLLTRPVSLIHSLNQLLASRDPNQRETVRRRLGHWTSIAEAPASRFVLNAACGLTTPILLSQRLPSILERFSKYVLPKTSRTSIVVLGEKECR